MSISIVFPVYKKNFKMYDCVGTESKSKPKACLHLRYLNMFSRTLTTSLESSNYHMRKSSCTWKIRWDDHDIKSEATPLWSTYFLSTFDIWDSMQNKLYILAIFHMISRRAYMLPSLHISRLKTDIVTCRSFHQQYTILLTKTFTLKYWYYSKHTHHIQHSHKCKDLLGQMG